MKKPVFPRIIGLILLYGVVMVGLVMIQFTKRTSFTRRIGGMAVSGNYREAEERDSDASIIPLTGDASIFYGGMEFCLSGDEGFSYIPPEGEGEALSPEFMTLSDESLSFRLDNGLDIEFAMHFAGGERELRISAALDEGTLELPFKPLRSSRTGDGGNGRFVILSDGVRYGFGRSEIDEERRVLLLSSASPLALYQVVPEERVFNPADYILPAAMELASYNNEIFQWRDRSVSLWGSTVSGNPDEDTVIAYTGEAVRRGIYRAAVSSISASFLNGSQRTHGSSVFFGRLDAALRSLSAAERERLTHYSRLVNERSADILLEPHVFEYLAVRGADAIIDGAATLVRSLDPAGITLDLSPGILEGWYDWNRFFPDRENPFGRLVEQTCFVISQFLVKSGDAAVLVAADSSAGTEFNFRLGNALALYGEESGDRAWAAVGRSLVLSVLSLVSRSGTVPSALTLVRDGGLAEAEDSTALSSARLYRILNPGEYYPRAAALNTGNGGTWIWTAASTVSALYEGGVLDVALSFPSGETHYVMLRGIRPFTKIQLYNMDYRTDPQFERYDSSGWAYSASEQTLLVKMKHRSTVEHIRIYY